MTRKALEKFDPAKLKNGNGVGFEVRNKATGWGEYHYFYRHETGELFQVITKNHNQALTFREQWVEDLQKKNFKLSQDNGIDHVAFTGKAHLTIRGEGTALCGGIAPFWYRVAWDGSIEGVCKKCLKVYRSNSQARKIGEFLGVEAQI